MLAAAVRSSAPRAARASVFVIALEWPWDGDPLLCTLYRTGDDVHAVVNMAHGLDGYDHAAYHAETGFEANAMSCRRGEPCGYDGDPELGSRAPTCAPSRGSHLRPV